MKTQMNVKIDQKDLQLAHKVAENRGEGLADFVRRSVRTELARLGYLSEGEKKSLGIEKK